MNKGVGSEQYSVTDLIGVISIISVTLKKMKYSPIIKSSIQFWRRFDGHDIFGVAAKTAFNLILSFFPLALLLLAVIANMPDGSGLQIFELIIPPSVLGVLANATSAYPGRELTAFSLLLSIWSASNAITVLMNGVYRAYTGKRQTRFIRERIRSLIFTAVMAVLVYVCVATAIATAAFVQFVGESFGAYGAGLLSAARFVVVTGILFLFIISLYYLTPGLKFRIGQIYIGAMVAAIGWMSSSYLFEMYMKLFSDFSVLYGSIGTFLGMALWLFIVSLIFLGGAELNALISERSGD